LASAAVAAICQPGTSSCRSGSILSELFGRVVYAVSTVLEYYIFNNMSKSLQAHVRTVIGLFLTGTVYLSVVPIAVGQDASVRAASSSVGATVNAEVERAKADVDRVERLVADGTLPRVKLDEARTHLADVEDQAVLTRTLYGLRTAGTMSEEEEANEMIAAAQRRVDREQAFFDDRQNLLASGAIARVDLESVSRDLEDRQRVLGFAKDRLRLLKQLASMAENERQLERSEAIAWKHSVIRSDGNGSFSPGDLTAIEAEFQKKFHTTLPISALGQTLTHQSLGLDHKNRVDVALSPVQPEGVWLMALLDRLHVPYLAFRNAIAGAATAPHIHIGLESTRLQAGLGAPTSHSAYSPKVR
jgi:hypothetical protein